MSFEKFATFLKKKGKKEHVVKGLVNSVKKYEQYLRENDISLDNATPEILDEYLTDLQFDSKVNLKNRLRAIGLYYRYVQNTELAGLASQLREQKISKTRSSTPLKDFRGINSKHLKALESFGIKNAEKMVNQGSTQSQRKKLSKELNIPLKSITEIVKLSDLSRIRGFKGIRARLYYDAGYNTLDKLAACEPEKLQKELEGFVEKTKFDGIAPLQKEIVSTIEQAKKLKRLVQY